MPKKPTVLIVGGGLGGLALAQALRKQDIPFRVFERDASAKARNQGYCLSLHWVVNDLLSNIPDDLPPVETLSHLHSLGLQCTGGVFNGITGERIAWLGPREKRPFIRTDREVLRQWLCTNVNIEWNKRFDRYEETGSGVTVYFDDGTSARGDVLIGADGGKSRVRTQLLGPERGKANLLPIEQCWGTIVVTREQYENELSRFGASLYVVELPHLFFVGLHRLDVENNMAQIYWATSRFKKANGRTAGTKDGEEEKEDDERKTNLEYYHRAIQTVQGMRPEFLLPLYQTTPDEIVNPPYHFEDFLPPEEGFPKGRVTLLGDAAHLMTPYRGQGANFAMKDAIDLARILSSIDIDDGYDAIASAFTEYEQLALPRAREVVLSARERFSELAEKQSVSEENGNHVIDDRPWSMFK